MSTSPKRLAVLASAAVAVAGVTVLAPSAQAEPGRHGLVITEVYGGGRQQPAPTYNADFVELGNPTGSAIDLIGMSLQYRSARGRTGGRLDGPAGTIAAGTPLPGQDELQRRERRRPADAGPRAAAIAMAAGGGQVLLRQRRGAVDPGGDLAGRRGSSTRSASPRRPPPLEAAAGPAPPATPERQRNRRRRHRRQLRRLRRSARPPRRVRLRRRRRHLHRLRSPRSRAPDDTTPQARQDRHDHRRGHRALPDRRLQRLLHPDRRHRRRHRPDAGRLRRASSSSSAPAASAAIPALGDTVERDRPGHRVRRPDPDRHHRHRRIRRDGGVATAIEPHTGALRAPSAPSRGRRTSTAPTAAVRRPTRASWSRRRPSPTLRRSAGARLHHASSSVRRDRPGPLGTTRCVAADRGRSTRGHARHRRRRGRQRRPRLVLDDGRRASPTGAPPARPCRGSAAAVHADQPGPASVRA